MKHHETPLYHRTRHSHSIGCTILLPKTLTRLLENIFMSGCNIFIVHFTFGIFFKKRSSLSQSEGNTLFEGLRSVLEGFVVTMHEGACEQEVVKPRDLTHSSHKLECIGTTNSDRSVIIAITVKHFQFHLVNVNILHLHYEYGSTNESRFACCSHYYVTWCPLTTGIVASQCPSLGTATLVTRSLHTFNIGVFKSVKRIVPQQNISTMKLHIKLKVVMLFLHIWVLEFLINGASDCHWEYGGTRSTLVHRRYLDAGHM